MKATRLVFALALICCKDSKPIVSATPAPVAVTSGGSAGAVSDSMNAAGASAAAPPPNLVAVYDGVPPCTGDAAPSVGLQTWTQGQVRARFGPPAKQEAFRAPERQGEFYAGIETLYPSTNPKSFEVPIEEWTWTSGDCILTVWFHRPDGTWRVFDDVVWHKHDDF